MSDTPPTNGEGSILIDTHCWIWLQAGSTKHIPPRTLRILDRAAVRGNLMLSIISVWEIGILESKGRVNLHQPCEQWVKEALTMPGLTLVPLTTEIAIESSRLPGSLRSDPADRIIAATARHFRARLATRDQRLLDYAAAGHIRVL